MCEPCAPDALLEAVRGLRLAEPELGLLGSSRRIDAEELFWSVDG